MRYLFILAQLIVFSVSAATLQVNVNSDTKQPVENAVVLLFAQSPIEKPVVQQTAEMKQKDRQFVPFVLPVAVNTPVIFPNQDNVKHHVYSFSEAKTFELKLYDDFIGEPIQFETPGIVELGCNIHDWMLAYIYVTDADFFATTDASGTLQFDVPNGTYKAQIWHPLNISPSANQSQQIDLNNGQGAEISFTAIIDQAADYSSGFDDFDY